MAYLHLELGWGWDWDIDYSLISPDLRTHQQPVKGTYDDEFLKRGNVSLPFYLHLRTLRIGENRCGSGGGGVNGRRRLGLQNNNLPSSLTLLRLPRRNSDSSRKSYHFHVPVFQINVPIANNSLNTIFKLEFKM